MKSQTLFEMNIPRNAEPIPSLKDDGTYDLLWKLPNGSYARLIFEDGDPVHQMYSRIVAMETAQRQADASH